MRISTATIYSKATDQLGSLQTQMARTQNQLSTNKRMLAASDDPIAAARALEVTQARSMNTQFGTNRSNARSSLSQEENAIDASVDLIQAIQDLVVKGGNAGLADVDRASIATELEGRLDDLIGVANTTDGAGGYLFSGYQSGTVPFTRTATGAQYNGDQGQRQLQVDSARKLAVSDPGSAIFENGRTGNGSYQILAAAGNTGGGVVSSGAVADATKLTGHDYTIKFAVAAGVTTYTITDDTLGQQLPLPPAVPVQYPYTSGQQIAFDGLVFDVKGAPANGDSVTAKPSQKQSIFTTVTDVIAALRAPASGTQGKAQLTNALNSANDNLKSSMDNVLTVQASVGARMKELDYLDDNGDGIDIQYATTLSTLQDLDMTKAISLFSQQQVTLQAAQQSFKVVSGLSLFNYLG
jgi:flagellar hook-associated protein 3 FlgL